MTSRNENPEPSFGRFTGRVAPLRPGGVIAGWLKRPGTLTPTRMVILMAVAIFICEVGVMFVLNTLPPLTHEVEAFIDSSILLTFLAPVYFFLYRPFWREHQQYEKEIRYLSRKLMSAAEEERKRVSQDLHDHFGQTLTALQFSVEALKKSLPDKMPEQEEQLRDIVKVISELGNDLREVTYKLRPAMLDEMGLFSALDGLVSEFRAIRGDVRFDVRYDLDEDLKRKLHPELEVPLYRIIQESLNNIFKYAQASSVSLDVVREGDALRVRIADDGRGFDVEQTFRAQRQHEGIGLLGMRERVEGLGGRFAVSSEPGRGVVIEIVLPLILKENHG